jgi:hypothetical protein
MLDDLLEAREPLIALGTFGRMHVYMELVLV